MGSAARGGVTTVKEHAMRTWMLVLLAAAMPVAAAAQTKTTFTNADLNRKAAVARPVPESELGWLRANQYGAEDKTAEQRMNTAKEAETWPTSAVCYFDKGCDNRLLPGAGQRFLVFGRPDEPRETTPWYGYTYRGTFINNGLTYFPLMMPTVPIPAQPQPMSPMPILPPPANQR
jgi:hypothetical protein